MMDVGQLLRVGYMSLLPKHLRVRSLTAAQIEEMCASSETQQELGRRFGLSQSTVSLLLLRHGKRRRHTKRTRQ